ncbi:hypothetical protein [Saliphagus sp. LR7]|uniref:hypothetical protein n=1 Tax=Saliphagus sp. LR7 TaxID=2282654 RepID=UPI000DF76746|nr:hypothetical protein [Saliphagus sp. LR7]
MDDDNPLADTGELPADDLQERAIAEEPTVDELEAALEAEDYDADQIRALQQAESGGQNRKTAHEALSATLEDVTGDDSEADEAADESDAEANNSNQSPRIQRAITGAGATGAGIESINLPDPRGDDAPDTVRIVTEAMVMSFAGQEFEAGEHDIEYTVRVKQALESENNEVRLSEDDPLHPDIDDGE